MDAKFWIHISFLDPRQNFIDLCAFHFVEIFFAEIQSEFYLHLQIDFVFLN